MDPRRSNTSYRATALVDLLVIAPLSANSMAKMTSGLADDLLLSVVRAWDTTGEIDASIEDMKKLISQESKSTFLRKTGA